MKKCNEQKNNIVQRLLTTTSKLKKEIDRIRSKSPIYKFKYELPESFLKAVDNARVEAGYDILPRSRHRSASTCIRRKASPSSSSSSSSASLSPSRLQKPYHHYERIPKISRSSSANDINRASRRKIQFRRKPREHANHHHQPQTTNRIPFSSRPPFRMMTNPNFMMVNRFPRPLNVMPMRPPILMQQRPMFRLRFR